ncbi:hypothetical protein [Alicyclobacillus fastidiosus]|uniref:Uncharacterized protein n=1 Tax=Alicyclobacillus fastidiosus TaxID=392011 RepID=A0ABV5AKW2_9BACL|nr:hypothetical protein [Alicyclobacillus fastidiosus]WEH08211.1 hypothetical protein PYS47_16015 [Alicyclobacillus fastidiosus]
MGSRHSKVGKRKAPRGNEGPKTKISTQSVAENVATVPDGSDLWDSVTPQDLRELINRYGHWGLRFPAKVVTQLLDEISRLEGQA